VGVRLGCLKKFTGAVSKCLSHSERERALILENNFEALRAFICYEKVALQREFKNSNLFGAKMRKRARGFCYREDGVRRVGVRGAEGE